MLSVVHTTSIKLMSLTVNIWKFIKWSTQTLRKLQINVTYTANLQFIFAPTGTAKYFVPTLRIDTIKYIIYLCLI
jgi:hypothetical protein